MIDERTRLAGVVARHEEVQRSGSEWLGGLRRDAMAHATTVGPPSTRDEEWKYTNISPLLKLIGESVFGTQSSAPVSLEAFRAKTYCPGEHRFVFVNGVLDPTLSSNAPAGVFAGPLQSNDIWNREELRKHFGHVAGPSKEFFRELNTATLDGGICVIIDKGAQVTAPIQIVFVSEPRESRKMFTPRMFVVAHQDSSATIIESHVSLSGGAYFTNCVAEVIVEAGASLRHYRLQDDSPTAFHLSSVSVEQGPKSSYRACTVTAGGALTRNAVRVALAGEESSCELDCLYVVNGTRVTDNHTEVEHSHPRCESRQLYKGILADHSRGVFNGKVFVRKAGQQTNAQQTNRNLILSDHARVDTKPQLEIFADDVKCTHGATIGQLDDNSLFYLKTRGIGEELGRSMLTYGFAQEVLERIELDSLRDYCDGLLHRFFDTNQG